MPWLRRLAIEIAPAAVASVAYFLIHGAHVTPVLTALAGYGLLMVLAQIPLLSRYIRLRFSLATWAFTFPWAAVASTALFWLAAEHVTGGRVLAYRGAHGIERAGWRHRLPDDCCRNRGQPPAPDCLGHPPSSGERQYRAGDRHQIVTVGAGWRDGGVTF